MSTHTCESFGRTSVGMLRPFTGLLVLVVGLAEIGTAAPAAAGADPAWVAVSDGRIPQNASIGGKHRSGPFMQICRADMGDGIHPGKVWGGKCNVGWGGRERAMPSYEVLVVGATAGPTGPTAGDPPPPPPPPREDAFVSEVLTTHNELRARHGAQPLRWSETLARKANDWALSLASQGQGCQLKLEHSPGSSREGGRVGENIAGVMFVGSGAGKDAVDRWYSEGKEKNYNYSNPGYDGNYMQTGHFTQVVWASTTELGCGIAPCVGSARGGIAVCQYKPSGNYMGRFPENVRPPVK